MMKIALFVYGISGCTNTHRESHRTRVVIRRRSWSRSRPRFSLRCTNTVRGPSFRLEKFSQRSVPTDKWIELEVQALHGWGNFCENMLASVSFTKFSIHIQYNLRDMWRILLTWQLLDSVPLEREIKSINPEKISSCSCALSTGRVLFMSHC